MSDSVAAQRAVSPKKAVSEETAFVLEADDARFLTEVGMLAASSGDLSHADAIFNALRLLRPDRAYPLVGLAVARLNAGRAAEAVRLLDSVRLDDPEEHATVQAWLGLALQLAGRNAESRRLLTRAAEMPGDGAMLARRMLGLAEQP
jgi:thioredoxin-like negative regulator of GroEL